MGGSGKKLVRSRALSAITGPRTRESFHACSREQNPAGRPSSPAPGPKHRQRSDRGRLALLAKPPAGMKNTPLRFGGTTCQAIS